jgi:GH35 family endo-1,4-beta-xylanase
MQGKAKDMAYLRAESFWQPRARLVINDYSGWRLKQKQKKKKKKTSSINIEAAVASSCSPRIRPIRK